MIGTRTAIAAIALCTQHPTCSSTGTAIIAADRKGKGERKINVFFSTKTRVRCIVFLSSYGMVPHNLYATIVQILATYSWSTPLMTFTQVKQLACLN